MSKFRAAIIGGGIAGLSAGFFLRKKFGNDCTLAIYEKDRRLGGTIGMTRANGFTIDWGPNGFLDKEPKTLEFVDQIGLTDKLLPADLKSERRFIYRNRKLWEISANPGKFMKSGLLSLRGRLRIPLEYFIPAKKNDSPESVYDFAARRIGREPAEVMIDPMVSGIFGGDAEKLELESCFPIMAQMEKHYGGLIRAMLKKKKASKGKPKSGGPAGPSGHLTSFKGGLYTIIERLEELLKEQVRYPAAVTQISQNLQGKYVLSGEGFEDECDIAIVAAPSYVTAKLVDRLDSELSELLAAIPYSNLAVVCQGFNLNNVGHALDGFGFLIPHNQNMNILGSIWTSVIFPEQAPAGFALLRTMLGGAKNNEIIKKSEDEIAGIALEELKPILDLKAAPDYSQVIKWDRAIPQYILGHKQHCENIENRLVQFRGLYLAGNAYSGIGLNDTIKRSFNIVENIIPPEN